MVFLYGVCDVAIGMCARMPCGCQMLRCVRNLYIGSIISIWIELYHNDFICKNTDAMYEGFIQIYVMSANAYVIKLYTNERD